MQDQIILVDLFNEAAKMGWTYLGRVDEENSWQGVAEIWCKDEKFVLLADGGNGYCGFLKYLARDEVIKRLFDWEEKMQELKDVKYSKNARE